MDLQNIQEQLNTEFAKESTRIIFWFDDKGEYEDELLLLNFIKEYPDMTNSLLAEKLGWSVSRVKYYNPKAKTI